MVVPFYIATAKSTFDIAGFLSSALDKIGLEKDVKIESKIIPGEDVGDGMRRESLNYDLVVMGILPEVGFTRGKLIKVPEIVAKCNDFPVVFVNETSDARFL